MATPLNILIVEDSPDDADLMLHELRREGFDPKWKRVETECDFLAGIKTLPDIVLSDYSMPQFTGLRAAELLQQSGLNIPFILISGTVGEDVAVEAMKHGATDYLLKDRIARLGPAVKRALEEKQLREEREGTAKALEQMHRRNELILNSVADGIHGIDLQGNITFENHAAAKIFGWKTNEMVGKSAHPLIHHSHADGSPYPVGQCPIYATLRDGVSRRVDNEVFWRKDGTSFFVEYITAPNRDQSGAIIGTVVVFRDITERKQAEETLRQSMADLAEGQQLSKMGSWRMDIASNKVRWSDELYRIFDVEPAAFHRTYEDFLNCVLLEDRPRVRQTNADARVNGSSFEVEYRVQTRDGGLKSIREIGHATKDAGGKVVSLFGTAQDITEHKLAEEELRWKTALLEAQLDSTLDGILVVNEQGKQILQNQRVIDLWKIPPHVVDGKDDAILLKFVINHTKNPAQFAAKIAHLYSHPDEVSRDEIELLDGTILDRYSSPVRDKAGNYYGRIWTFRDITEQRKLEEQFRQSQKMEAFGQLAGGVAHDFNNILAVIQLQAGLLKSGINLSLEQLCFAGDIEKAAERAANLTRQLLLLSRKQAMQPQNLKLKDAVDNITRMLQRTLGEQVQLQFKFSDVTLAIHADPGMIDQILLNLIVNARDAMPKGGQITIETSAFEFDGVTAMQVAQARPGSFACISVTDTGCGIPPGILPRIFEPFFTTKEVGKGTGLGLATVFGIVQQHNGWINVDSEVGRGSTFRVYLPRLTESSDTKFIRSSLASMPRGDETILLVEDESSLLSSMRIALSRLGYRVLEASTGNEALAVWQQHRDEIRLVLTDLVMPDGMTGKDLAQRLLQENPKLKVIYMSGYSAEVAGNDFPLKEGVNFLAKPFQAVKLAQTVREQMDEEI
jgi:two-component system, cell cycle sensor histidine kinase and response regulator CckA